MCVWGGHSTPNRRHRGHRGGALVHCASSRQTPALRAMHTAVLGGANPPARCATITRPPLPLPLSPSSSQGWRGPTSTSRTPRQLPTRRCHRRGSRRRRRWPSRGLPWSSSVSLTRPAPPAWTFWMVGGRGRSQSGTQLLSRGTLLLSVCRRPKPDLPVPWCRNAAPDLLYIRSAVR